MKKLLINAGGIIIFYAFIILGVFVLNYRFEYLNNISDYNNNLVAVNK